MAITDGTIRQLAYPLNRTVDMQSGTPDEQIEIIDLSDWGESDPDIQIPIVMNLSLNEYVALASSIDVGRDIAYGDNSILIWWVWVRSLQSMAICQAIIDCIDDPNSGVADSIVNLIASNNVTNTIEYGQSQSGLLLGDGNNTGCDSDIWWGGINNMVDQLDTNNSDALQILEVLTNINEWIAQVATGIAGMEIPIVQSMLDWGLFIQQSILENYEAQITTAYLDEIKCDLFCIAQRNCALTPEDIVNYFFGRLDSQLTFESLLDESLEFIFFGIWTGTEIADAMMLSQVVFRAQLGRWFDFIAFNSIDVDIRLGFNDPSNDWELLCECGWSDTWLNGNGTPTVDGWSITYGTYDAGNDRIIEGNVNPSSDASRVEYLIPAGKTTDIKKMTMTYDVSTPVGHARTQYIRIFDENLILIASETRIVAGVESATFSLITDTSVPENYKLMFQAGCRKDEYYARLDMIAVEGTGDDLWV